MLKFQRTSGLHRTAILILVVILIGTFFWSNFSSIPGDVDQNGTTGAAAIDLAREDSSEIVIPDTGSVSSVEANVPKYGIFEVALTAAGDYANPYLQMPADNNSPGFVVGTFTAPSGKTISMDGFWDGGKSWKIRIAPTEEGAWTYTTASPDAGLNGKTGSFVSVPSSSKGFLRVDPDHPHHFMWEDGTPFYWAPVTLMISHFDERDAQGGRRRADNGSYQQLLDLRASQGFNTTHWGFYGFNKTQFNDRTQQNEGGPPFVDFDPERLNPAYYQYGDQRIEALLERGLIPTLTLGWPDQDILGKVGHANLKRNWRYLIARYAAYNIVYGLFGEVEDFGSNYLAIVDDYADLTRKVDPYDHLLSVHTIDDGIEAALANKPWLDFITLQVKTDKTSSYLKYGKPVVNSEYMGYEGLQVNGEELRRMIWDVRMRGGYFVYENWTNDPHASGSVYSQFANLFFKDRTRFWLLEYHPEFFGNKPGLADPGNEYIYYLASGDTVKVDLSKIGGVLDAQWYNPRTGELKSGGSIEGGKQSSLSTPEGGDWVLHIVCSTSSTSSQTIDNSELLMGLLNEPFHIFLPHLSRSIKNKAPAQNCG